MCMQPTERTSNIVLIIRDCIKFVLCHPKGGGDYQNYLSLWHHLMSIAASPKQDYLSCLTKESFPWWTTPRRSWTSPCSTAKCWAAKCWATQCKL